MKRDYVDFQDRSKPIGYLITFRCYGTWLHGDKRGQWIEITAPTVLLGCQHQS